MNQVNVTKIRKYYVIFVYILQGKMGKKRKENHATKVTIIPKTKRRKYGINKNIRLGLIGSIRIEFMYLLELKGTAITRPIMMKVS